ncbi:MAG TPA: lamin tail domain-containing protein [Polyangiaceae bacterium]|nr:lamin tail domain-containing protein [Polyangiaceae bacterium]
MASVLGCAGPALDLPQAPADKLDLELEPAADPIAIPLGLRGRLRNAPPGEPWLFSSALSDYHDRALRQGELPQTLRERAVPLRFWREGSDCLLQPLVWLEPSSEYSLALTGHGRVATLRTVSEATPRAERFFPAVGVLESAAVLCGSDFPDDLPAVVTLEPGGIALYVSRGVFGVARRDCVTLVAATAPAELALAPPSVGGALLEPSAFVRRDPGIAPPNDCLGDEVVPGGCLEIQDDRLFIRSRGDAALWQLSQPRSAQLSLSAFERHLLLDGLTPGVSYELLGQVVFGSGEQSPVATRFKTRPAQRHLVISEVLANAVGAEPESEWIEVVNDSSRRASLADVWLEDAAGSVPLPDVELAPGALALLVGAGFRASALDVPPPPEVQLIELPALGARGLSNSGESLLLVGREGVLSRFPALAAPRAGRSLARRTPATADDDARGFAEHGAPGASPGLPNSFD